jgi:hypothetical protein
MRAQVSAPAAHLRRPPTGTTLRGMERTFVRHACRFRTAGARVTYSGYGEASDACYSRGFAVAVALARTVERHAKPRTKGRFAHAYARSAHAHARRAHHDPARPGAKQPRRLGIEWLPDPRLKRPVQRNSTRPVSGLMVTCDFAGSRMTTPPPSIVPVRTPPPIVG